MTNVTDALHIARNNHILGRVNRRAGWNSSSRIRVGYTARAFDVDCEIAIGQWGCGQSAVLAFKFQMLWSAGGNLNHTPVCDLDGSTPFRGRGGFAAARQQQHAANERRDDEVVHAVNSQHRVARLVSAQQSRSATAAGEPSLDEAREQRSSSSH